MPHNLERGVFRTVSYQLSKGSGRSRFFDALCTASLRLLGMEYDPSELPQLPPPQPGLLALLRIQMRFPRDHLLHPSIGPPLQVLGPHDARPLMSLPLLSPEFFPLQMNQGENSLRISIKQARILP